MTDQTNAGRCVRCNEPLVNPIFILCPSCQEADQQGDFPRNLHEAQIERYAGNSTAIIRELESQVEKFRARRDRLIAAAEAVLHDVIWYEDSCPAYADLSEAVRAAKEET